MSSQGTQLVPDHWFVEFDQGSQQSFLFNPSKAAIAVISKANASSGTFQKLIRVGESNTPSKSSKEKFYPRSSPGRSGSSLSKRSCSPRRDKEVPDSQEKDTPCRTFTEHFLAQCHSSMRFRPSSRMKNVGDRHVLKTASSRKRPASKTVPLRKRDDGTVRILKSKKAGLVVKSNNIASQSRNAKANVSSTPSNESHRKRQNFQNIQTDIPQAVRLEDIPVQWLKRVPANFLYSYVA